MAAQWIAADIPDNDLAIMAAMGVAGYSHAGPAHAGNGVSGRPVRTVYYRGAGVTAARVTSALVRAGTGVEFVRDHIADTNL